MISGTRRLLLCGGTLLVNSGDQAGSRGRSRLELSRDDVLLHKMCRAIRASHKGRGLVSSCFAQRLHGYLCPVPGVQACRGTRHNKIQRLVPGGRFAHGDASFSLWKLYYCRVKSEGNAVMSSWLPIQRNRLFLSRRGCKQATLAVCQTSAQRVAAESYRSQSRVTSADKYMSKTLEGLNAREKKDYSSQCLQNTSTGISLFTLQRSPLAGTLLARPLTGDREQHNLHKGTRARLGSLGS